MIDALSLDRLQPLLARLAPLALAIAAAWLALQLIRLLWLGLAGPTLPPPEPAAAFAPTSTPSHTAIDVAKWHLFGTPGTALDLARLAQQAPATSLKLTLRGTFNEGGTDAGYAIISDESGVHKRYQVGEQLPGDAELIGIYVDRVLLRRAGVEESLSLPSALAPGAGNASAPAANSRMGSAPLPSSPGSRAGGPGAASSPFINPNISVGAPSMESIRAATGTDIAELAKQVSVFPVLENGRFAGVRLSVGRDSDLLDRAGLRPTDIITAVNGIPLDGPERSSELMAALQNSRQITLTVNRDGTTLQLPVGL